MDLASIDHLLRQHRPRDGEEARHLSRMHALLELGAAAFASHHYGPGHFTASAFVVSPERDAILLIHHAKLALWLQPGGHFEPTDASPAAAARRELHEETGIALVAPLGSGLLDVDVHTIPARSPAPTHEHFDLRFAFVAADRAVTPGSDAKDARWVAFEALMHEATDASVRRAAVRLRDRISSSTAP